VDLALSFKSLGYGNNLGYFGEISCEYLEDIRRYFLANGCNHMRKLWM
jgi:hypothetical protein